MYEDFMRDTTPAERVRAISYFYTYLADRPSYTPGDVFGILAWVERAVSEDGWKEVAPAWVMEVRKKKEK